MHAHQPIAHETAASPPWLSVPPAPPRLAVRGLSLDRDGQVVLADVSLAVTPGQIFGLFGPNGCGKSSLIRCITGTVPASHGSVWLDGQQVGPGGRRAYARLGVVFQDSSLDLQLGVEENLLLFAQLFAVGKAEARRRAAELLDFMGLAERASDPVGVLSGGLRRRLELARALIHRPSLLLLDEPTLGLDLGACERTWQLLTALRRVQGLTVVVSTHRPDEAERCDQLLVLDRGRAVACDRPADLLKRVTGDVILLEADEPELLVQELGERMQLCAHVHGAHVVMEREHGHTFVSGLVEAFAPGRIRSVAVRKPNLADAFFHLTGHGLHDVRGILR